ncbi:heavy metal translocating P-type ATPase [Sulfurimonas sp.]|uniref:heavy metal translocating P-type ATPase n=1 Tax=Sulfurimonas sp. TaxID=2022749 RepID=UPI002626DD2F|nr:heavy metal translocating P-type ATPase [Sulfurimonas sp.]MDD5156426.1 heavy metal translocating P-type ATPase [Sulfurimonas sp.]
MSNSVACSHCHIEFDKWVMIQEEEHSLDKTDSASGSNVYYFCCKGCQSVFHLLKDKGFDSFYDKSKNATLSPPPETFTDSSNFDVASFYERFVKTDSDGFNRVSLIIEGIHCSACIWLNEKALHSMDGVIEANINFTNNKATIVWAGSIVKLSEIIEMIRSVGYDAFAYDPLLQELYINKERKAYYLKMAVAIFSSMNIMWIAVAQYAGYFSGITQDIKTILNIAEWILSTPVLFYSGWIFFRGAYYGLKRKTINMDLLVATGSTLTYIYSIYVTIMHIGEAYFDSVSMIITFVLIGKFLEVLSKKSASDALDVLTKNIPTEVKVIKEEKIVICALDDVMVGDVVIVSSGERILLDGVIVKGDGSFDESSLTGESNQIYKTIGNSVISGTTSIDADIHYKAIKDFKHSTLSNIISLLESAINKKPKIEQLANRLSEYFSSIILLLSFATFAFWWITSHNFEISFMVAISVIIIACPCALALATPVATLVGLSASASRGILFKEAAFLETMAKIDTLVLDKTGTITQGKPEVIKGNFYSEFDKNLLYSLVKTSNHPMASGVAKYIKEQESTVEEVLFDEYMQIPAKGIRAKYKGIEYLGGNIRLLREYGIETNFVAEESIFYFAVNNEVVAIYELKDKIKSGIKELMDSMKQYKIEVVLLSGDHENITKKVAKETGIENFLFEQTPQDKAKYIDRLHGDWKKVVMVGDGINDILALASADIAIAMGGGSDIAVECGDVVLLDNSLKSINDAIRISRGTFGLIKQNLAISLLYNSITIPLAMAGFVIPLFAAISMSFSSLLVVGNSIRNRKKWSKNG